MVKKRPDMKNKYLLFSLILLTFLSLTFISANWFTDTFGVTGRVTANCGNGIIEPGEQCDGEDALGKINSCTDFGFKEGKLTCSANCVFDTSKCVSRTISFCGNGIVESWEQCDDGNSYSGDGCYNCQVEKIVDPITPTNTSCVNGSFNTVNISEGESVFFYSTGIIITVISADETNLFLSAVILIDNTTRTNLSNNNPDYVYRKNNQTYTISLISASDLSAVIKVTCGGFKTGVPVPTICTDSDGGINYEVKGTLNGFDRSKNSPDIVVDFCEDSNLGKYLWEYYCDDSSSGSRWNYNWQNYNCSNGCSDGACITNKTKPKPVCKEGDTEQLEIQEGSSGEILGVSVKVISADETNLKLSATIKLEGEGEFFDFSSDGLLAVYPVYNGQQYTISFVSASDTSATIQVYCGIKKTSTTPSCKDSDSGQNYDVKGKLSGFDIYGNEFSTADFCADSSGLVVTKGSDLVEMYCYKDTFEASERITCPNGCSDGACVKAPTTPTPKTPSLLCRLFKFFPVCKV